MPRPAKDVSHLLPQVREMVKGGHVTVEDVAARLGVSRRQAWKLLDQTRRDVPDLLAILVADRGRAVTEKQAAKTVRAAGAWCGWHRLRRLLTEAKNAHAPADEPQGYDFAGLESPRADGLFTAADLVRAFGLRSRAAVTQAAADGLLTVAKREPWGKNGRSRPLFGPAENIAVRNDGWPGPVDAWHSKAAAKKDK